MSTRTPPRLAVYLLRRFSNNEPLAGDLVEAFHHGRSRAWFWIQTLHAVGVAPRRLDEIRPIRLVETRITPLRTLSSEQLRPIVGINALNISASPIRGIGGLGIVLVVVFSTMLQPGLWPLLMVGVLSGVAAGGVRIAYVRRHAADRPALASALSLR